MRLRQEVHNQKHWEKMKINSVLEAINRALDEERAKRSLDIKGHFTSTMNIKKSMGPYKHCYINIVYVNPVTKEVKNFCEGSYMERVLVDRVEDFIDIAEQYALTKFFIHCHEPNLWEDIIKGEYGTK